MPGGWCVAAVADMRGRNGLAQGSDFHGFPGTRQHGYLASHGGAIFSRAGGVGFFATEGADEWQQLPLLSSRECGVLCGLQRRHAGRLLRGYV